MLTDNGIQFADLPKNRTGPTARLRGHPFDRTCAGYGIEHRLTKPNHPWTNGQVERMNRTIKDVPVKDAPVKDAPVKDAPVKDATVKDATVKRFHYDSHDHLRRHPQDFVDAYNFGRRLKTLKGLTPYEFICQAWTKEPQAWTKEPERFRLNPIHQNSGPNT